MHSKEGTTEVVARIGDRTFVVPTSFWASMGGSTSGDPAEYTASINFEVLVEIGADSRPRARQVQVTAAGDAVPLSALDLQRTAWARVLEGAVETAARDLNGDRRPKEVHDARAKERRRSRRHSRADGVRTTVNETRLRAVVEIHDSAQAEGLRWDVEAADQLGYSPGYIRKLYGKARKAGLT